ncbi:hypothetical protein KF728_09350 [Candidatus Obscuribacterales bacterium]|nr:hypothetical protein [Candidatus Obscuribacterales bacterium]
MQFKTSLIGGLIVTLTLAGCSTAGTKPETSNSESAPVESSAQTSEAPKENVSTPATTSSGEVYEGTITGVISDSMCGKDHSKMGELGKTPAKCIEKCVASGAKFVLVDEKGDSYALSDQEKTKDLAGKHVAITGHIDPSEKAIHVHKIVSQ